MSLQRGHGAVVPASGRVITENDVVVVGYYFPKKVGSIDVCNKDVATNTVNIIFKCKCKLLKINYYNLQGENYNNL